MKSVKLLSMTFLLLGFGKVGFCEMFAKRGTLQRRGREVLRDEMFKKIKTLFSLIIMLLIEIYFSRFIVLNLFPISGQFVEPTSRQIQHRSFCDSCSTLPHPSVLDCWTYLFLSCNFKFANTLRMI